MPGPDMWLTPGSVILHKLDLRPAAPGIAASDAPPQSIGAMARGIAAGRLFDMCDAQSEQDGRG